MKTKEVIKYVRVKYLRGFVWQYSDLDQDTVVPVCTLNSDSPQSYDLIVRLDDYNGKEYPNENSYNGQWYIVAKYRKNVYDTFEECEKSETESSDPADWKRYIRIRYLDTWKYQGSCKRYMEVTDEEYAKYCPNGHPGKTICIKSKSNPRGYEEAKIISSAYRQFPPESLLEREILGEEWEVKGTNHESTYKQAYEKELEKNEHLKSLYDAECETTRLLNEEIVNLCEDFVTTEEKRVQPLINKIKSGDIVSCYKDLTFVEAVSLIDSLLALSLDMLHTREDIDNFKEKLAIAVEKDLSTDKFSEINMTRQIKEDHEK